MNDINTSVCFSQTRTKNQRQKAFLSDSQSLIFKRVKRGYSKLNIKSLLSLCGNNHSYQTYILCTQSLLAICQFMSVFAMVLLFSEPGFECITESGQSQSCPRQDACASLYGYHLNSQFLGVLENYGIECSSDLMVVHSQTFIFLAVAAGVLLIGALSNKMGRRISLVLSSILHIWGALIICFSMSFTLLLVGIVMVVLGFLVWVIFFVIMVYETLEKKAITLAIGLVMLLGSLGLFLDMLIVAVIKDYRALSIFCMLVQSIAAILYFEYVETPEFEYRMSNFGRFYSSLKYILQTNYSDNNCKNRMNALKGLLFNTDDSSFWVSSLIEGRLPASLRPKDLPKPTRHFLDDSQIDMSEESHTPSAKTKTLSAKAPEESDFELEMIEKKLFNEECTTFDFETLNLVYDISLPKKPIWKLISAHKLKLFMGALSLLAFHIVGIFLSRSFISKIGIYPQFYNNILFGLAIFAGVLGSCLIAPENHSRNLTLLFLVSICVICINFATIEYSENSYQNDHHFISIPHLMTLHAMILTTLLCSNLGFLLVYVVSLFSTRSRGIVVSLIFGVSFVLIGFLKLSNFASVFDNGLELNLLFLVTVLNILVAYLMPQEAPGSSAQVKK